MNRTPSLTRGRAAPPRRRHAAGLALALWAAVAAGNAGASDHGQRYMPSTPPLAAYTQECASCHLAYPSRLLPAASWQHLMANLPRHFGADASLDTPTERAITTWLVANAGSGKRGSEAPPEDRITLANWFVREHREVSAATWKRPAVKSASQCSACHRGAEQGDFNEHDVRIPR